MLAEGREEEVTGCHSHQRAQLWTTLKVQIQVKVDLALLHKQLKVGHKARWASNRPVKIRQYTNTECLLTFRLMTTAAAQPPFRSQPKLLNYTLLLGSGS